ncbi:TPA: hypothetical protein DIV55_00070 [Patescibacteria group bacterium]|uniref:YcfA family protein n=1 Tax=Candidatus Gottesmanbacteria bacterium GW2011_GWA1_43_11 TaxID=1618436 RepID=A0A0G1ESK2_9BACT|nr:MAG: hypothetical protein UV59_C0003G0041 [Candidatus Gottesmanbacteria bacterium GW2011_GWA1_43_11]HCS78122.1 hypothetical protein [Patescibacteria group bacterium]
MSNLPQISGNQLVKAFKRDGWKEKSQKGSHLKLIKILTPVGKNTIIVPLHKTLKKGTLGSILKDAKISVEKLKKLL